MGENRSAMNAPTKEGFLPSTLSPAAEAHAPAVAGYDTPIPAAVPKPRLSLPTLLTTGPTSNAKPAMENSPVVPKRDWNTSKLGLRIGVDALSAGAAGALVAPIITMVRRPRYKLGNVSRRGRI